MNLDEKCVLCRRLHPSPPTLHLVRLSSLCMVSLACRRLRPSCLGQPPLFSLVSLAYQRLCLSCLRPTASLLPVSLACQSLHPGPPILPLPRVLLPSSPLLLPLPARTSPVASAAQQASERVPRARASSLAWHTRQRPWPRVHKSWPDC